MNFDGFLSVLAIMLAPFSILSAGILVWVAAKRPRVGLLVERAVIGVLISVMVLSGSLITFNRLIGYALFPLEIARLLFLAALVLLAFVPPAWLVLLATDRLGEGES